MDNGGPVTTASNLRHGHKRPASDHLENEQRLSKRFNLLNLNQTDKSYIAPVQPDAPGNHPRRLNEELEPMQVDETKDKVYIYNLDQELSDIESEEERLIFLPDIDKKLGKIPKSVLAPRHTSVTGSEMILYNIPSSLSVPPEHDNVRKAIIESRARAREKQVQGTMDSALERANGVKSNQHFSGHGGFDTFVTADDAMDIE